MRVWRVFEPLDEKWRGTGAGKLSGDGTVVRIVSQFPGQTVMTEHKWLWEWTHITRSDELEPILSLANSSGVKSFINS
jgi:uncharacterized membrane protein